VIANTPSRLVFFLVAAFCRRAKALSHSQQMGWLVGAVGIEPATLGSSGSIRVKENSVQLIGLQVALCNASFGKYCDSPPLRRRLYNNCDTKPVLAAQIDFFDELRLLILIVIRISPKISAYRLADRF